MSISKTALAVFYLLNSKDSDSKIIFEEYLKVDKAYKRGFSRILEDKPFDLKNTLNSQPLAEKVYKALLNPPTEFAEKLQEYKNYHTRVTVLGHVQRGGSPSARDRVLGSLFGYNAVQLLKEGKGGLCIGISGSQVVFNDIIETLERKRDVPYRSLYQINKEISF